MVGTRTYTPPPAGVDACRALMDRTGVGRVVLVQPTVYGLDNRCLLDAMAEMGAASRGVVMLDASVSDRELERLNALGVRGVRCNLLLTGGPTLQELEALAPRIAPLGWHLDVNLDPVHLSALAPRVSTIGIPVVIDHVAGIGPHDQAPLDLLADLMTGEGVHVKLSSYYRRAQKPDCADMGPVLQRLIATEPGRVLWGSDWPHPLHTGSPVDECRVLAAALSACDSTRARRMLMVDNPARLYGFDMDAARPGARTQATGSRHARTAG